MFEKLFSVGAQFSRLPQSEDCESLVPGPASTEKQQAHQPRTIPLRNAILLFFITFGASGLLGLYIGSSGVKISNKFTIERISKYCAPAHLVFNI